MSVFEGKVESLFFGLVFVVFGITPTQELESTHNQEGCREHQLNWKRAAPYNGDDIEILGAFGNLEVRTEFEACFA